MRQNCVSPGGTWLHITQYFVDTCMRKYIHTYAHTCAYMHTCIHTYIHTYVHRYFLRHTSVHDTTLRGHCTPRHRGRTRASQATYTNNNIVSKPRAWDDTKTRSQHRCRSAGTVSGDCDSLTYQRAYCTIFSSRSQMQHTAFALDAARFDHMRRGTAAY